MNYSIILYILGCMLKFESIFLALPFFVGLLYKEESAYAYLITSLLCLALGFLLCTRKRNYIQRKVL